MKRSIKTLFFLVTLSVTFFESDRLFFNGTCNAQQDRRFLVKQRLKKVLLDVEMALEKEGDKLASNLSKERFDLDPINPIILSGELNDKGGATIKYSVFFHEDASMVELGYSGHLAISGHVYKKLLKGIGDKAAEVTYENGNKMIVFKRGNYVVSLVFPSALFSLSTDLADKFIKAIDKHKEP